MEEKKSKLNSVKSLIIEQNICSNLASNAKQLVFGEGNMDADIIFVGEAPGKNEDETGRPFVGAAGSLLDKLLDSIGLRRNEVYITNIVKYRPPNNRDPLNKEKQAFLPFLQAQIEVIQPQVIVPLGRHSMSCFLPDLQISKAHGQAFQIKLNLGSLNARTKNNNRLFDNSKNNKCVIVPQYHPAAALYNGGLRQTLFDDFAKLPAILQRITK